MRKLTAFLATILSFIVCLGGVSPALAQQAPGLRSRGITTLYVTSASKDAGADVYRNILKYDVAIPNPDLSAMLPENLSDFPETYKQVLAQGRQKNGINGSFTEGWFDLQGAIGRPSGSNQLFTIEAPDDYRIYSVVAGLPASQCPLTIKTTEVDFFDDVKGATEKAVDLDKKGFFVYVSPDDDLTIKAFSKLFYDQDTGKKKTNPDCFLVSGATQKVTMGFSKVFSLLPPKLQQDARQSPFQFTPRSDRDFMYLVNARKTL